MNYLSFQKYLLLDEADLNHNPPVNKNLAIAFQNASFSWVKSKREAGVIR